MVIMNSINGKSWNIACSYSSDSVIAKFTDVYWDGNAFVAVGNTSNIVYSPDGANWYPSTFVSNVSSSGNPSFNGVVSNGTTWVAVGQYSNAPLIMISTNGGQSWYLSTYITVGLPTIASNSYINTISVINGLFMVGVYNYGSSPSFWSIYTSPDGNKWTFISKTDATQTNIPMRIMMNNYANDTIFMVGTIKLMYSTNGGVGWTTLVNANDLGDAANGTLSDIRMINSTTAIAVGNVNVSGGSFAPLIYTIDITATPPTATRMTLPSSFPDSYGINSLCSRYAPIFPVDKLVFGSNLSNGTLIQYNNPYYNAATSYPNSNGNNYINARKIIYNGNTWLAVGNFTFGGYAFSSTDGMNWSGPNQLASNVVVYNIYWNGSMAVAVGGTNNYTQYIIYSYDLLTWNAATYIVDPTCVLSSVIHNGSIWVAAGYDQSVLFIYTSRNGLNWAPYTGTPAIPIIGGMGMPPTLGLFEGTFILNVSSKLFTSTDGNTWVNIANASPNPNFQGNFAFPAEFYVYQIMQMNNLLIVAGYDNNTNVYAYYSSDIGKTWTGVSGQPVGTNGDIYKIYDMKMISPTTAMMVGTKASGTALTLISTNGITWTRINNGYTAFTGLNQIYSFSGTYSEIVLNCDPPTTNTQIMGQANPNQSLTLSNKYTSSINAVPTYINIPYVNVTFPSGITQIPITITLTQKTSTSASTPVATGTFTLLSANVTTYTTTGISIPLKLASSSSYIVSGYTVTYTLSVTSDAIGTGSIQVLYNFGLIATLHGRTYFLPSTLTLPTATSGGTQWYIPSPIVYYSGKTVYGKNITNTVPASAGTPQQITYSCTTTGNDSITQYNTNPNVSPSTASWVSLTLGNAPATINVIASYPGSNVYAATSVTTTVYSKDYVPVSPQTAMFLNKSGLSNPINIGAGGITAFNNSSCFVNINATDNVTLNEFNFGCKSLLGLAGYMTSNNNAMFTMTVKNGSTIVTTVVFTVIIPPSGAQGSFSSVAQYYAATYEQNATNWGYTDGMLLSIPFYNISNDLLPTYVTSFSLSGTPSPQFKLGDTIQISLSANNTFSAYISFDNQLCGALIATPTTNLSPNVPHIYNNPLPSIAYEGSEIYSSTASQANTSIGLTPAITVHRKTMLTGFLIENIGSPSSSVSTQLQFLVYNQNSAVLTINIQCTLPVFNTNPMNPLYIPFSYASQQNNTTANAIAIQHIAFIGTQNPIFEIGSNVSFQLTSLIANVTYKYNSAGSPNVSTFVSSAYGTLMLANTQLAVVVPTTPVRGATNKTIALSAATSPTNVGGAITYSLSQNSPGWVTLANNNITLASGSVSTISRITTIATQSQTGLYNAATAYGSFDVIGAYGLANNFYPIATTIISYGSTSYSYSNPSNPMAIGANIYSNNTIITGVSFVKYGGYIMAPGRSATMSISKLSSPNTILATVTFTASSQSPNSFNSNDDGNLFFIPFINGNTFNENTYPITIMPTYISSITGTITDPNALTFNAGDTILIKLSGTLSNVLTLVGNGVSNSLVGSIISSNTVPAWNNNHTILYSSQPPVSQPSLVGVVTSSNPYSISFTYTPSQNCILVGMTYLGFATNNPVNNFPMNLVISNPNGGTVFCVTFNIDFNVLTTVNGTQMYGANGVYIPFDMSDSSSSFPSITTMYGYNVISNVNINSNPIVSPQLLTFTISPVNNTFFYCYVVQSTNIPVTQVYGYNV